MSNKQKQVNELFVDIETFQYNEYAGYQKPSEFKNGVFSVEIGYFENDELMLHNFFNFSEMFNFIENLNTSKHIKLYFHNGRKYDNHFLLTYLLSIEDMMHQNLHINNIVDEELKRQAITKKSIKEYQGNIVAENRVKSSSFVDLFFKLNDIVYETIDTYPKTGLPLRTIGKKLLEADLITQENLKTDFDYTRYNLKKDLTDVEALKYAKDINNSLTQKEIKYIENDIIILAYAVKHFTEIFKGSKISDNTATTAILREYSTSKLANLQLKNKIDNDTGVAYSDYYFRDQNLSEYINKFYKGGLNFYNDTYIAKKLTGNYISFDKNSSYPEQNYKERMPTYLRDWGEDKKIFTPESSFISDNKYHYFSLYEISIKIFNELVSSVESIVVRKMLVKYYSNLNENVYINTNTLNLINLFTPVKDFEAISYLSFETALFDARDVISNNYRIKMQGKNKHAIEYIDPFNIKVTDKLNQEIFDEAEKYQSKVTLNGLYGAPALRPFFNYVFYNSDEDVYEHIENGFANTERNKMFSIATTSFAVKALIEPLSYLNPEEIDKYFVYADTDSLYINQKAMDKIPNTYIDELALGKWKIEHEIKQIYVLNHKKYAFLDADNIINVRAGGVPANSFDTDMAFEKFIDTQFKAGVEINGLSSIVNKQGTISLYTKKIKLDEGFIYLEKISVPQKKALKKIATDAKKEIDESDTDGLYIETPFGTLSIREIEPPKYQEAKLPVTALHAMYNQIKNMI